jgi:hypothetical protein
VEVRNGNTHGAPSTRPDRWNRELIRRLAAPPIHPQELSASWAGTAMASDSSKYRRIEEEFLIPVGFGWTVIVIALYIAEVVLQ